VANNQLKKWDEFTREPNRYIDIPGEHYTLMGRNTSLNFQAILTQRADRRWVATERNNMAAGKRSSLLGSLDR